MTCSTDAVVLAASAAVDPSRSRLTRHLRGAVAAGAYRLKQNITPEEGEVILHRLRATLEKKIRFPYPM